MAAAAAAAAAAAGDDMADMTALFSVEDDAGVALFSLIVSPAPASSSSLDNEARLTPSVNRCDRNAASFVLVESVDSEMLCLSGALACFGAMEAARPAIRAASDVCGAGSLDCSGASD